MPTIATELKRLSHVVKSEYSPSTGYCRKAVTANETAITTYAIGTVLGRITANGKYRQSLQTAVDGSQNPIAVVMEDTTLAANTDKTVLVLERGPSMVGNLSLHATFNDAAKVASAIASLATVGIIVLDAV